ncbi:hypothetical protein ABH899_001000 [Paenibacillus sp. RC84]
MVKLLVKCFLITVAVLIVVGIVHFINGQS